MHNTKNSIFSGSFANQGAFKPVNTSNGLKVRNKKPHGLSQMSAAAEDWEDEDEGDEEEEDERCQKGQRFAEVNVKVEGDEGRNDCDGVVVVVKRHRLGELWVVLGTLFYNFLSAM